MQLDSTATEIDGTKRELMVHYYHVDTNYLPLLKIKLKEGRNFSASFGTDKEEACIVNEAFVKAIGWKSGLGQFIDQGGPKKRRIIRVVSNYIYRSIHNPVEPLILVSDNNLMFSSTTMNIKPASLPVLQAAFRKYLPSVPFDYSFMDDAVNKHYATDRTTMNLFNDFPFSRFFCPVSGCMAWWH